MGKQRSRDEVSNVLGIAATRFQSRERHSQYEYDQMRPLTKFYQANVASMSDMLGEMRVVLRDSPCKNWRS